MTVPAGLETGCGSCLLFGAIEGLADGLILVDPDGKVFHVNRAAAALLGVSAAQVQGGALRTRIRQAVVLAFWDSAAAEAGPVSAELVLPGGRTIRATASTCLSEEGIPIGRALMLRDVTREKMIQVRLSEAVATRLVEMTSGETPGLDADLTRRELQILELLAGGLSNAAIAARLHVSVNTVASHLKHLYAKIKVSSRTQAAAYALQRGIHLPIR
ncbi:MAG TPA: LuxR C-terminal-related transcriptional regulator [Candidatus Polarisedimenticolia bacterium]|nr:LuxR C-terminal-related transcriptional regulator [Candidatus Polarisedimenticolia bacterium]